MTDNDRLLSRKARHLHPSSPDEVTLERAPSSFDEKAIGARRADHPTGLPRARSGEQEQVRSPDASGATHQRDHDLGGTPVQPEKQYDVSDYLKRREGAIDSDVNIAKLALPIETDAAIGYIGDTMDLKS